VTPPVADSRVVRQKTRASVGSTAGLIGAAMLVGEQELGTASNPKRKSRRVARMGHGPSYPPLQTPGGAS
jgi:hypothetical protein